MSFTLSAQMYRYVYLRIALSTISNLYILTCVSDRTKRETHSYTVFNFLTLRIRRICSMDGDNKLNTSQSDDIE